MTGSRGPQSKEGAIRRNAPKAQRVLDAQHAAAPSLDRAEFSEQALAWWDAWIKAPQAQWFTATDWLTLRRGVALVQAFYLAPSAQLAAELRQIEARFGGSPADRDRLGWVLRFPEDEGEAEAKPAGSRAKPDPRKGAN